MPQQLFIPDRIKVGYQARQGTYTNRLAYVIYYDLQGKLRKETSWENWRHHDIDPDEYKNEPTEGFVLNRNAGGKEYSYGWNTRKTYIRVWDPRGFEFEISVPNLLFILQECDCTKGKGLEGQFVYAWDGQEIVLLPTASQDYQQSQAYTGLQAGKVSARTLIPGATYITKKQEPRTYLGKFPYYWHQDRRWSVEAPRTVEEGTELRYIFWDEKQGGFHYLNSLSTLAALQNPEPAANLADLIALFRNSTQGSRVLGLTLGPKPVEIPRQAYEYAWQRRFARTGPDNKLEFWTVDHDHRAYNVRTRSYTSIPEAQREMQIYLSPEGIIQHEYCRGGVYSYPEGTPQELKAVKKYAPRYGFADFQGEPVEEYHPELPWVEPNQWIYAELETGESVPLILETLYR